MTPSFRPRRFGMVRIGSVSARAVLLLSVFSGGLALTYEVIWTRHLLNLFGSTTTATAAMLAAFMAGMALGAWTMGRWSVTLRRPLLVYAVIEIGLGIYGLVFGNVVNAAGGILSAGPIAGPGGLDFTLPIGSVRLNLQDVKTPMAGILRPSVHTTRPGRLRGSA